MKIVLNNLGPIKEFQFDLEKDLTIIFGKNNIGKSYAITAIYLILKNLLLVEDFPRKKDLEEEIKSKFDFEFQRFFRKVNIVDENIKKDLISRIKNNSLKKIDITEEVCSIIKSLIQDSKFFKNLDSSFKNSFSSVENIGNAFANKDFSFFLDLNIYSLKIGFLEGSFRVIDLVLKKTILLKKNSSKKSFDLEPKIITFYYNSKKNEIIDFDFTIYTFFNSMNFEVSEILKNVYFLPASRSGLYQALSTFSAIIAELSKSRNFLTSKIELPNISEPVSDYFLYLSNINSNKLISKRFDDIIKRIENEIIGGRVLFNKETKKIYFASKKTNLELDLSFTSSMISEIAPIVAYLKYVVKDNSERTYLDLEFDNEPQNSEKFNLIFIEEPEAHLHPEIQIALMEIFTKLVKKKIKIIMTSHSNYMFNKLNNLVLQNEISFEKVGSYLMKMEEYGSVNDSVSMMADKDGISDENFADVAEYLYDERIAIFENLNNNANQTVRK